MSRGTVVANFGDANGLAAVVWAQFMPDLERRLAADRERDASIGRILERHLHRVIDLAKSHRALTAMMLDGVLAYTTRHGAPTYGDPADPRTTVPLPLLLVPVFLDHASELRRGVADSLDEAMMMAATVTNLALLRGLSRPGETATDAVHHTMDVLLDGILAR